MSFAQRTDYCGNLRSSDTSRSIVLNGWAHRVRDLGGVCFIDLRDRTGIVQITLDPQKFAQYAEIKNESCLSVRGTIQMRSEETRNPKMATGEIELIVDSYEILGPAKPLPFPISDEEQMLNVNEELRIKHRYIDLRRPSMYRKLALRASAIKKIRAFLDDRGFIETETPIITRSTPEGARDYLVPYRLDPGKFYALPQSPQQYKQLLMVAGLERYYQIAKCFRDESQRADRQPEFTQLDLEMSFVVQEDILQLAEQLTLEVCNGLIKEFEIDKDPIEPFERLSYDEALQYYGTDKPDLRFGLRIFDVTDIVYNSNFGVFSSTAQSGGMIRGLVYPGGGSLSRKDVGELEDICKEFGAKGMASLYLADGEGAIQLTNGIPVRGSIAKFFSVEELEKIVQTSGGQKGDLLCFIADKFMPGNHVLSRLRNEIGDRAGLRDPRKMKFAWVLDFPLVEWNPDESRWDSVHHPFTMPKHEDLIFLDADPGKVRADCYDIVCNGVEWASGSIRIHRPDIQAKIFSLLGINEEIQRERFGHMLDAFQLGAPPHGGIAPGIDRLVMLLLNEENIREVIAFPKIGQGYDPMMDAPSTVDESQWAELGLQLREKPQK